MRIGIDIRELEKNKKTGIGRYLLNFLEYINEFDHENEYILFACRDTRLPVLRPDIKIKVILEVSRIYWDQIVLSNQIKQEKIDIFYSPYYKGPIFSPARLIVTCHDLHFLNLDSMAPGELLKRYYCRTILEHANTIIAVSEYSKQTIESFLGYKSPRIEVVFDSVSDKFKPLDKKASLDELKQSFNLKADFILYVGNLKPHKNLDGLIKAYSLLPSSLKEAHQLVIAGKKDENFLRLWKFVKSKSLENNVVFLDLIDDEDLICLYNASSFLALVSFCEGFGLPALEAMACGIPVLVSNTTSLPEIVADMGLQVDPHNSQEIAHYMEKLLTDESLRQMLSTKGSLRAKNFSIQDMAEKILRIFKQNYKYLF